MVGSRIPFGKRKRPLIGRRPRLTELKIKNQCQYPILPDEYQERAAEADREGMLYLLDGQLRCKCGARVGASKSNMGDFFAPTAHSVYQPPPSPPRKRSPGK